MRIFTFVLFHLLLDINKVSVVKRKKCCVISDGLLKVFPGPLNYRIFVRLTRSFTGIAKNLCKRFLRLDDFSFKEILG